MKDEIYQAFEGLEESYREMIEELDKNAPKCHFRKMALISGEVGDGDWWECSVCGHTKELK